jgi:hypothetical protein
MTKPINLRFSGSQWVRIPSYFTVYIPILSIATNLLVLHPRHKLQYFKNAGWEDDWIERAEEIVRTQFDLSYGSLDMGWATSQQVELSKAKVRTPISHCK